MTGAGRGQADGHYSPLQQPWQLVGFGVCSGMLPAPPNDSVRHARIIGKARTRGIEHSLPREWTPVLDVHPTAFRPDALPGYAWLQFADRVREVRRQLLEFWYDPPGCALTDEELALLRRLAEADEPIMFHAERRSVPAYLAFDHQVDVLRDLRKAGWIVLEVWRAEKGQRGHARRQFTAAQARCTASGQEALEVIGL